MFLREEQPLNALLPIAVKSASKFIEARLEQFSKQLAGTAVTEDGNSI